MKYREGAGRWSENLSGRGFPEKVSDFGLWRPDVAGWRWEAKTWDMERTQIRFYGMVQGVGFRLTTRSLARGFEVTGWVRNEMDGSVLLEAQGEGEEVRDFLEAIRERMGRHIEREQGAVAIAVADESGFVITS